MSQLDEYVSTSSCTSFALVELLLPPCLASDNTMFQVWLICVLVIKTPWWGVYITQQQYTLHNNKSQKMNTTIGGSNHMFSIQCSMQLPRMFSQHQIGVPMWAVIELLYCIHVHNTYTYIPVQSEEIENATQSEDDENMCYKVNKATQRNAC